MQRCHYYVFALSAVFATSALAAETAKVGQAAPDFSLVSETGKTHTLKQYRGKTVVLEWTNPRCPFVKRHGEEKTMATLAKQFAEKDVVWLAINSSHFTTAEESKAFVVQHKLTYPILQDPSGAVGHAYGARTTPHLYVIDKNGVLRYAGAIDDDPHNDKDKPVNYARGAIEALAAKKMPAPQSTEPYGCSVKYKK